MVFQSSALTVLLIGAALCVPPFLMLRLFSRSYRRAQKRRLPSTRFLVALVISALAFVFNLGVLAHFGWRMAKGSVEPGNLLWAGIATAWVALWIWIFFGLALGRSLRRNRRIR